MRASHGAACEGRPRIDSERAKDRATGEAMKSIWFTAVVLTATIILSGCKHRREEPVPGPKYSAPAARPSPTESPPAASEQAKTPGSGRKGGANGISWFQGTVEEAFSTNCAKCTAMFWPR
jgi:hypothetical protein